MILQRRLVDIRDDGVFIGTVGADRIQVLGPLIKRTVENILVAVACRVGIVPRITIRRAAA